MSAGFNLLQGASQIPAIDSTAMSRSTAMSQSTAMYWEYEIGSKVVLGPIFPFESNNVMWKNVPAESTLNADSAELCCIHTTVFLTLIASCMVFCTFSSIEDMILETSPVVTCSMTKLEKVVS